MGMSSSCVKFVPGGADRSYGIHVAKLAGLPPPVIARAQEVWHSWNNRIASANLVGLSSSKPDFLCLPQPHPLIDEVRQIDLFSMTPLDALNRLAELQKRAIESPSSDPNKKAAALSELPPSRNRSFGSDLLYRYCTSPSKESARRAASCPESTRHTASATAPFGAFGEVFSPCLAACTASFASHSSLHNPSTEAPRCSWSCPWAPATSGSFLTEEITR